MRGINGIQCNVHPKFLDLLHDWQNRRIASGKDSKSGKNQLSTKRLSLTLCKYFKNDIKAYNLILDAEINKHEE